MRKQFISIQVIRGIAIIMVLLVHVSAVTRAFNPEVNWEFLYFGSAGVDLFFVVSGFIICLVIDGSESDVFLFLKRRFLRIYPFYILFTVIWILMSLLIGREGGGVNFILKSLAIVPQKPMPYLFVGWSLEHEVIFYALVAALLVIGRPKLIVPLLLVLWGGGVINWVILPLFEVRPLWDFHFLSLYHVDFVVGVVLYRLQGRLSFGWWPVTLALGLAAFPVITWFLGSFYPGGHLPTQGEGGAGLLRVLLFASASCAVVASLICAEMRGRLDGAFIHLMSRIGNASFSLYLMHHIIFAIFAYLVKVLSLPEFLAVPVSGGAILSAIGISLIWYRVAERPFHDWSSGRSLRSNKASEAN